ncbi:MAG: T9SS type A sorting domain-containing protein, partial [Candidatus Marinimicrobia bacterium]|nr:T9SS type A sorting domain-containing protein [Candidatus Neomarinimicrobiota bacterium]
GHDNFGNWGGAIQMTLDPEQTNVYTHLSSFDNVPSGSGYEYKFVILTGGDVDAAIWEGSDNRSFTATGLEEDTDDNGYGEIFQPVAYFADVTPDDIITQDVTVTFELDISSAYRALAAGDTLIDTQTGSDDITLWSEVNGVTINGVLSQWWDWGNDVTCVGEWAMTQTDTDGLKYSFTYLYSAGQAKAQQAKFGINSLDNEAGFAQNRNFVIDDAAATYTVADLCFGEQNTDANLPFPQSCEPLSIASLPGIPTSYALSQNYPNPFNPTTTINIALPEANNVVLTIYNALGQEVRTLKTDYLNAGNYSVTWDGLDNSGNSISSGLYIYTMTAGHHNFSKKMLMLK